MTVGCGAGRRSTGGEGSSRGEEGYGVALVCCRFRDFSVAGGISAGLGGFSRSVQTRTKPSSNQQIHEIRVTRNDTQNDTQMIIICIFVY